MNTQFTINNFRIYDAKGAKFELSPITLLTGCNSAGKSSLVKALMLLTDCLKKVESKIEINNDFSLNDFCIDFSSMQNNLMGRFDKVLNRAAKRNEPISFAYTINSNFLADILTVELSFVAQPNDELNRGWLSAISFRKSDGEVILNAKIDKENQFRINTTNNLSCIKSNFLNWAAYSCYLSTRKGFDLNGDEREDLLNQIKESIDILQISTDDKLGYQLLMDQNKSINSYKSEEVWTSLKYSLNSKTILYLPLVTKLSNMTKNECIEYLLTLRNKPEISNAVKSFSDNIIQEFTESKYDIFMDYYLAKEDEEGLFLKNNRILHNENPNRLLESIKALLFIKSDSRNYYQGYKQYEKGNAYPFCHFYQTMIELCKIDNLDSINGLINKHYDLDSSITDYSHKLMELFVTYLQAIILEAISPMQFLDCKYVGSNRINVQRLYTFDDKNSDFSQVLLRYFNAKKNCTTNYIPNSFINSWLKKIEIGESIEIKLTEEGFGATIYLTKQNGDRVLLADEGYGISQLVSVILEVETAILESKIYKQSYSDTEKALESNQNDENKLNYYPSTIAIEEPEVHLHPRYQSMLAEMFLEAYKIYNIHFIIETHSEYLIRKLQTIVARQKISASDIALHYIDNIKHNQSPNIRHIEIETDGRLSSPLGSGFFDEADNLAMNLLEIKAGL